MGYRVDVSDSAAKQLWKLRKSIQPRFMKSIGEAIDALADDPRPPGVEKLEGADNLWRVRAGKDYRVVYSIDDAVLTVLVVKVRHRKDVYQRR